MDYDFLRREGIRHIERLGSQQWTDYNTHDPGITILEQLCYALTDLLYRIDYPIPDLLAEGGRKPFAELFTPSEILTTNPITLLDLRKLLLDIPGVRNAWIERLNPTQPPLYFHKEENTLSLAREDQLEPLVLQGIYQIWLEADTGFQGSVPTTVTERLHEYRGLAQDFRLRWLEVFPVSLTVELEIDAAANPDTLQQAIDTQISHYFSPPTRRYTLPEGLEAGLSIDELFEGPALEHGFIDSAELRANTKKTELRTSDLIRLLMDIPGVRLVRRLEFANNNKWLLRLDDTTVPRLDKHNSHITLIQAGIEIPLFLKELNVTAATIAPLPRELTELPLPPSQNRHIGGSYYSIQHQFPDTYGINSNGLSASASPLRKAQVKQLKAYLLLFEQLLSNHFAQLANVWQLLAFTNTDTNTYFCQLLNDPSLGLDENAPTTLNLWTAPNQETRRNRLAAIVDDPTKPTENLERKHRFLNHLLARFAEQLVDDRPRTPDALAQHITRQQAYLRDYATLGQRRNTAINYRQAAEHPNISGLEQRIRLKLGLGEAIDCYIIEHILLRPLDDPLTGDQHQTKPILTLQTHIPNGDPYSLWLSVVLPAGLQTSQAAIREAIPAHLKVTFRLLEAHELAHFQTAYQRWLTTLSISTTQASHTSVNYQGLRAARDHLIDLLGFGRTYPLTDLAVSNEMVPPNEKANIRISFSQPDVRYQLCQEDGKPMDGFVISGNGGEAILTTPPITEDTTYRILACKSYDADSCKDNPYSAFLVQTASIKVGLDTTLEAEITGEIDSDGHIHPITLLTPPAGSPNPIAARLIHFSHLITVAVRHSQEGVNYQLFPAQDARRTALSEAVTGLGSGNAITIHSHALEDDTDIHIRISRTPAGGSAQTNWLNTLLPLKVRANPNLTVAATPSPILAFGAQPMLTLTASQPTVAYQAFQHSLADSELVFGNDPTGLLSVAVTGYPDVHTKPPAWQALWQTPPGYTTTGAPVSGNGGELMLTLPAVHEDSVILIQAAKPHQENQQTIVSAVPLRQAILLLVAPDPEPALVLRIHHEARLARTLQVANGQAGVFYHFRLSATGEDISSPAYFHHWANRDYPENKGINQLRIEGDLVIAANQQPQTPQVDLHSPLPDNATLHIHARKARTNVATDLTHAVALPRLPTLSAPQEEVDAGTVANITVSSETGVRYQLLLNQQMQGTEVSGDSNDITLSTAPITADSQFTVRSIHAAAAGIIIELDQTVLIKVKL
ncbi:hypothetical protein SAMN05660964_01690 [Thiothrix caldifontis]|uniref:Uncharacterized protein n=1 Tax=Thiothrix caldifontis TaxID=525918 RepID=A0A1H4BJM8_9GAMM|nr:hypothetical protein [Thiothrix caldifontis]SEA48351.1 hypothetical protein SAMN05660964_01690 [Thiothrix caldifontis]